MLEKTIKRAVKLRLNAIGAYHHWPVQSGRGTACLDCHGCYKGRYFAIECKAPGKKTTLRQDYTMDQIYAAGGLVFVVDSVEQANGLFNLLVDFPHPIPSYPYDLGTARPRRDPVAGRSDPAA